MDINFNQNQGDETDVEGDDINELRAKIDNPQEPDHFETMARIEEKDRTLEPGVPKGPQLGQTHRDIENQSTHVKVDEYLPNGPDSHDYIEYYTEEEQPTIFGLLKDTSIIVALVVVMFLPFVDNIIMGFIPEYLNNPYIILSLKAFIIAIIYMLLKIFYLD